MIDFLPIIGITKEGVRVDDIIETANRFRCIDEVVESAHFILKTETSNARKNRFAVGDYKKLPNGVGGRETTLSEEVPAAMKKTARCV